MTISSIPQRVQELKDELNALQQKHDSNNEMINQILEDMQEIVDIVKDHAQLTADQYTPTKLDTTLPEVNTEKTIKIEDILDEMYKI